MLPLNQESLFNQRMRSASSTRRCCDRCVVAFMSTFFSPSLQWKLEPHSPPYVSYRNIEAHRLQTTYNQLPKPSDFISNSWDQTMYYKHRLKDCPISGNILMDTLLEDSLHSRYEQLNTIHTSRNSLLGNEEQIHLSPAS